MELIKLIENNQGAKLASARDLHLFLEIKTDFTDWMKRMIAYGFTQDEDYLKIEETVSQGVTKFNYALKLDMAKEISMIQRTPKGKEARLYFIECERIALAKSFLPDFTNPVLAARAWADEVEAKNNALQLAKDTQERVLELEPKAELAETFLISNDSISLGDFSKVIGWGRNNLFKQMRDDKYLMSNNIPYQRYVENGYFILIEVPVLIGGKVEIKFQPRLNVSGQRYFQKKYGK